MINNSNSNEKVLVAMSGGVDSAAAAILLKNAGYTVFGVTFFMHGTNEEAEKFMSYAPGTTSRSAREAAEAAGAEHIVRDLRPAFRERVTDVFVSSYACGETPNPCVTCNRTVKFHELLKLADEMGIDKIATGHYSEVVLLENGRYTFKIGRDAKKDQTYMLYTLPQSVISRLLLPLEGYEKSEIRELVRGCGISCGDSKDSQDICFIPNGDYAEYMEKCGFVHVPGNYVDINGNVIGHHLGFARYTRGQRKGLGVAFGHPMYVNGKNAEENTVTLTTEDALFSDTVYIKNIYTPAFSDDEIKNSSPFRVSAKIRYTPKFGQATVYPQVGDGIRKVVFDEPQRAATTGQHCVFYSDGVLLGGGEII